MEINDLSEGSVQRLRRIQELKHYDEKQALEYAITITWLVCEQRATREQVEGKERG